MKDNPIFQRMETNNKTHIQRLYRPFVFDRQKEHSELDPATLENPILNCNGESLRIRVSRNLIYQGYALRGESIDDEGEEALAAFFDFIDEPKMFELLNLGSKNPDCLETVRSG